jgi:hypothetical protein
MHVDKTRSIFDKLVSISVKNHRNPYQNFIWPEKIPEDQYWMSPELMSVYATPYANTLSEIQLFHLSKWECISFFSINVHGIRGLMSSVIECIHTPGFEDSSEYLHHFLGEENEHMWFFAHFCLRYGGKIYKDKGLKHSRFPETDIEQFLSFARILIFEEIGDFYNIRMMDDERLHPIIREISLVHHQDESRHLIMGRELVKILHIELCQKYSQDRIKELSIYLEAYMKASIQSLYSNPTMYRDAGIEAHHELRRNLLIDNSRQDFHNKVLSYTIDFFRKSKIFT